MAAPATTAAAAAAVFGCTGLVGSHILSTLLASEPAFAAVHTISRRAPKPTDPKLHAIIEPDTTQWAAKLTELSSPPSATTTTTPPVTTVFSALGTTRAQAGGLANQWKIDHDLNVELAQASKTAGEGGVSTFVFVSSTGVDKGTLTGRLPYSRMKQGVEAAVRDAGFAHAVILRPGLILGNRDAPHQGLGSWAVEPVARTVGRVFGSRALDTFAQEAEVIARAAVSAARLAREGKAPEKYWVLEGADIIRLGRTEWQG